MIVTLALSGTVSEIRRRIGSKSPIFIPHFRLEPSIGVTFLNLKKKT